MIIEPFLDEKPLMSICPLWLGLEVISTSSSLGKARTSLALHLLVRQFKAVRKTFLPHRGTACA